MYAEQVKDRRADNSIIILLVKNKSPLPLVRGVNFPYNVHDTLRNTMTDHQKIQQLREQIRYHNVRYHIYDEPEISDRAYDALFAELIALEEQHPELITPDSPTQKLAVSLQKELGEARHHGRLLSLENSYNAEDLYAFDERVKRLLGKPADADIAYLVDPKYDGLSIALTYVDGKFTRAATRGDGEVGEDVTQNIQTIASVPLHLLGTHEGILEVRGEVLMSKASFADLNEKRAAEGQPLFANPRNAAAGSVRQLDPRVTAERNLDIYFYDITYADSYPWATHTEELDFLASSGLRASTPFACANIAEAVAYVHAMESKRAGFPYEIDGLVLRLADAHAFRSLGETGHHPRGAAAYKFPAQEEMTILEGIEIQVGRTGVLTPVAHVQPVEVAGVMVRRATLHNIEGIHRKDVRVGDTIILRRAGDVIPQIVKPVLAKRPSNTVPFSMPMRCPACASTAVQLPEEVALRCINASCPAQIKERLIHFVSKGAMDIDGFGRRSIAMLADAKLLTHFSDIYTLADKQEQVLPLLYEEATLEKKGVLEQSGLFSTMADTQELKRWTNLVASIDASKKQSSDRLLFGLGIRFVGKKLAKVLAESVSSLWDLAQMSKDQLVALPEIGDKVAESILDFFQTESNIEELRRLEAMGLSLQGRAPTLATGPLSGKTFLFTGTLSTRSREEAQKFVEELGGTILSSVSKNLSFLVVGEKPGSKVAKAEKLGVPILSEDQWLAMLEKT